MIEALEGIEGVHICADDILISGISDTYDQAERDHDSKIRQVFGRCLENNLKKKNEIQMHRGYISRTFDHPRRCLSRSE